jgi:hypothetical protein
MERNRHKLNAAQLASVAEYESRVKDFLQYLAATEDRVWGDKPFDFEAFRRQVGPPVDCFGW